MGNLKQNLKETVHHLLCDAQRMCKGDPVMDEIDAFYY